MRPWVSHEQERAGWRDKAYFILMGVCLALFIAAWVIVRLYSTTAAVVMSFLALAIPPIAAIVANAGDEASRRRGHCRPGSAPYRPALGNELARVIGRISRRW
jgi:hypothetical protein